MRAIGNDAVAVAVRRIQVKWSEFIFQTQWRTGIFMPAKGLLLKIERHAVPVLQRHPDPARDDIAAATHPVRAFASDPDKLIQGLRIVDRRIARSVLETH